MQQLFRMRDAEGNDYDVPVSDMNEFSAAVPNASRVTRHRDKAGNDYDVPDSDADEFKGAVPDATPLRRMSFADGSTRDFTMPELSQFLRSKEWREGEQYKADRDERDREVAAQVGEDGEMHSPAWAGVKGALKGAATGFWEGGNAAANKIAKAIPEIGVSLESALGNVLKGLNNDTLKATGNWFLADAASGKAWLDAKLPDQAKDWVGYEDWSTKTADKFADVSAMAYKFAPAMATGGSTSLVNTIFASDGINAASQTFDNAMQNGFTLGEANKAAAASFLVNFYGAKLMTRAGGVADNIANPLLRLAGGAAGVGTTMGVQSAANRGIENVTSGRPFAEGMGEAFEEGNIEGLMFHGINAIPGAVIKTGDRMRESREVKEYRRDSLLEVARGEDGGEFLNTLLSGEGLDAAVKARKSGVDVSRKIGERAGLPDNMSAAERNEIIDAIAKARGERAAQNAVKVDGFRSEALNASIKELGGEGEVAQDIRARVIGKLKNARELDDPFRREELVSKAFEEWNNEHPKEKANATGNGTAETPAKPAEAAAGPEGRAEAPRPVEGEPPRGEAPDAGVVEKPTVGESKSVPKEELSTYVKNPHGGPQEFSVAVGEPKPGEWASADSLADGKIHEGRRYRLNLKKVWNPKEGFEGEDLSPEMLDHAANSLCDIMEKAGMRVNRESIVDNFRSADESFDIGVLIRSVGKKNFEAALRKLGYDGFMSLANEYHVTAFDGKAVVPVEGRAEPAAKPKVDKDGYKDADGNYIHFPKVMQDWARANGKEVNPDTLDEFYSAEEASRKPYEDWLRKNMLRDTERNRAKYTKQTGLDPFPPLKAAQGSQETSVAPKTGKDTPAPEKPVEPPSRAPNAKPVPDGKGKMVKPKAAESDYGITMSEEPSVDGDGVRYVVKDGPGDAHRMMFNSKAEAEARLGELRAERKAIQESPSATLADGKKVHLLKTNEGWVPYDENYNDLRHGMFKAAKTKAEAVEVAEKGVKWARDVAEENARLKAEAAKPKPDGKGKMVKPAAQKKPTKANPKKAAKVVEEFVSKDKTRTNLQSVFHDHENGVAVATDGRVLIATKHGYDPNAKRDPENPFPKWKQVVPDYSKGSYEHIERVVENGKSSLQQKWLNVQEAEVDPAAVSSACKKAAALANKIKHSNPVYVRFELPDGKSMIFDGANLRRVADAMAANGITKIKAVGPKAPLLAENADTTILAMPVKFGDADFKPGRGGEHFVIDARTGRVLSAPERSDNVVMYSREWADDLRRQIAKGKSETLDFVRKSSLFKNVLNAVKRGETDAKTAYESMPGGDNWEMLSQANKDAFAEWLKLKDENAIAEKMAEHLADSNIDMPKYSWRKKLPSELEKIEKRIAAEDEIDSLMSDSPVAPKPAEAPAKRVPDGKGKMVKPEVAKPSEPTPLQKFLSDRPKGLAKKAEQNLNRQINRGNGKYSSDLEEVERAVGTKAYIDTFGDGKGKTYYQINHADGTSETISKTAADYAISRGIESRIEKPTETRELTDREKYDAAKERYRKAQEEAKKADGKAPIDKELGSILDSNSPMGVNVRDAATEIIERLTEKYGEGVADELDAHFGKFFKDIEKDNMRRSRAESLIRAFVNSLPRKYELDGWREEIAPRKFEKMGLPDADGIQERLLDLTDEFYGTDFEETFAPLKFHKIDEAKLSAKDKAAFGKLRNEFEDAIDDLEKSLDLVSTETRTGERRIRGEVQQDVVDTFTSARENVERFLEQAEKYQALKRDKKGRPLFSLAPDGELDFFTEPKNEKAKLQRIEPIASEPPKSPEAEISERLDLKRLDPKRRSDPKVLAWAKKNGRTVTNGMVTPDAVRAYDEAMTENTGRLVKRWFPDMKIVAHKFGETIKRGQHVIEQRNAHGLLDTSHGYTVADLKNDGPYLQKNNQAPGGALSNAGNASSFPSGATATHAVLKSLDGMSISNRPAEVKGVFGAIRDLTDAALNNRPSTNLKAKVTAKNLISQLWGCGFNRENSGASVYFQEKGNSTTRASDHSATASFFREGNNLSLVIRRPSNFKRFDADNTKNVVEAIFKEDYLEKHPELIPHILRDLGEFIATGEYHDTAGAMAYNYSGSDAFKAKARDRIRADALARGDMETAQKMEREAAAKAMPNTVIADKQQAPVKVYHFTKSEEPFTVFDREKSGPGMFGKAFYFFTERKMAENWGNFEGKKRKVVEAFLNVKRPYVDSLFGYDEGNGFDKSRLKKATDEQYRQLVEKLKENGYEIDPEYSYDGMYPYSYSNGVKTPINHGLAFLSNALKHKTDKGGFGWKHSEAVRTALEELGYDGVIGELDGYTQVAAFKPNQIKSADPVTYDRNGKAIPLSQRFDLGNPDFNYLRDTSGGVLGWFDPKTKEVHLLPGADPKTVAHEIMWHGTRDYISQLAAKGDKQAQKFLDMMHDVEQNIPAALKQKIIATYTKGTKAPSSDTLMNEFGAWFTMEKGGAALEKALQTAEGRNWFAKAFYTVKEMYKDFLTRHGRNRVDLSAIDGMTRDEFVDFIAKEFASGKTLGEITGKANELSTKETKFQAWRRKTYDVNAPVRDLERDIEKKTGKKISADDSVETANALKYGLKEAANIEIQGKMADLRKSLGESGIHYEDLEYYAALKAAEGRDAKIDKRNIDDLTEKMKAAGASAQDIADAIADYKSTNGSHIDPREAKKMLAEIENGPDAAKYKAAYDKLRAVIDETLDTQIAAGLVDAKEAAKWRAEEPNYIPFKNEYDPESGDWEGRGSSRNFVKPEHHMAKGRQSAAGDIIAHIFMDHQAAKHRAIENAVRQKLAALIRTTPEIGKVEALRPEAVKNLEKNDPNVIVFKDGGRAYAIHLNGTRGAAIANAFTQRNLVNTSWADKGFSVFGKKISFRNFSSWSSGMATRYSPTFFVRNFTKDNIELAQIVYSERGPVEGTKWISRYVANQAKMAKTLAKYVTTGKIDSTTAEGQILDRYIKAGGLIAGGVQAEGMESIKAKLSPEAITKEMKRGSSKVVAAGRHVLKSIQYLNEFGEMATRLNAFATEVQSGKSDAEAALFSRRATVDFNRHGDWTPATNMIRLFSNSSLGATARAAVALGKSKYGKIAIAGLFANGMAQALIEHYANADEDERRRKTGEATGKDMGEFDRETALFYFRKGDKVYKISQHASPFSIINYAGNCVGRWLCGDLEGGKMAKNLGVTAAEMAYMFLPFGSINMKSRKDDLVNNAKAAFISGMVPSSLQPIFEMSMDMDYKGDSVFRHAMNEYDPKSHNAKIHTPDWAKQSAEWLNEATGGNQGKSGWADIPPEALQKLVEGFGKNAGRDISMAVTVGESIVKGDFSRLDPRNTPVKRDFVRPLDGNDRRFNDALTSFNADKNEFSKMKDAWTPEERKEYKKSHPWVSDEGVKNAMAEIKKLRKMEQGFWYKTGKATPHEWPDEKIEEFKAKRRKLQAQVLEKMGK